MTDQNDTHHLSPNALPVLAPRAREVGRTRLDAAFSAHVLGAGGVRRGLRGGQPVLQAARTVYLQTEWSGGANRRSGPGDLTAKRV